MQSTDIRLLHYPALKHQIREHVLTRPIDPKRPLEKSLLPDRLRSAALLASGLRRGFLATIMLPFTR